MISVSLSTIKLVSIEHPYISNKYTYLSEVINFGIYLQRDHQIAGSPTSLAITLHATDWENVLVRIAVILIFFLVLLLLVWPRQ